MYKIKPTWEVPFIDRENLCKEDDKTKLYSIRKFFIGFFISIISIFILNVIIDIICRFGIFGIITTSIITYVISTGILAGIILCCKE